MDFRTEIDIPRQGFEIDHKNLILMMGSCFTESIGRHLDEAKFKVSVNPFGILYNPVSISQGLNMIRGKKLLSENDLFKHNGLFHSYYHHGQFSDTDVGAVLDRVNEGIELAYSQLLKTDILFITFGTAYVYELKESGLIVGNCHKLPASKFDRYRLDVNTIVDIWIKTIEQIRTLNPRIRFIFTVSPIRHLKDGAHENQLSKSMLLLAVDEISRSADETYYFPSYEIVMDELRDYRFYNEDMVHPNALAVKYIWERFVNTYFSDSSKSIIAEWSKLSAAIHHRPFNAESEDYKHFLKQTLLKLECFQKKYPYIYCEKEITLLKGAFRKSNKD